MAIDADVTEGCNPVIVNFTGGAGTWDFGDGSAPVTVGANPSRIYSQPGTYVVSLAGDDTTVTIEVHDYPTADFGITGSAIGCASSSNPFAVQFEDMSSLSGGNVVQWFWDFGDGNTSDQENPIHNYTTSGTFSVTLRVTSDQGCENTVKKDDVVITKGALQVNFIPSVVNGCSVPQEVQFYNASINDGNNPLFAWEFFEYDDTDPQGLGTPYPSLSTTDEDPLVTFTDLKSYSVRFTVVEPSGCQTSVVKQNVVRLSGYDVDFSWGSSPPANGDCSPYPIQFTGDFNNVEFNWQDITWQFFDDTDSLIGSLFGEGDQSFIKNPLYSFEGPGTYKVKVKVDGIAFGCPVDSTIKEIVLPDFIEPQIDLSSAVSCSSPFEVNLSVVAPGAVSYEWDYGNDNVIDDSITTPTASFSGNGQFHIEVFVRDSMGCKTSDSTGVEIEPLNAQFLQSKAFGCASPGETSTIKLEDRSQSPEAVNYWKWQIYRNDTLIITEEGASATDYKSIFVDLVANGNGEAVFDVRLTVTTASCSDSIFKERVFVVGDKVEGDYEPVTPYGCKGVHAFFEYAGEAGWDSLYWYSSGISPTLIDSVVRSGAGTFRVKNTHLNTGYYTPDLIVWSGGCADTVEYENSDVTAPRYQILLPTPRFSRFLDRCNPDTVLHLQDQSLGAQMIAWDFGDSSEILQGKLVDFDPLDVILPSDLRYPWHKYDGLGPWEVKQLVFHDNIIVFYDSISGDVLSSNFSQNTGTDKDYRFTDAGDSLLFAPIYSTSDSISIVRCGVEYDRSTVFEVNTVDLQISHDQDTSQPLCAPVQFTLSNNTPDMREYYWRVGGGVIKEGETHSVTISTPGFYTVELIVVSESGCTYKKVFPDFLKVYGSIVNFEYCPPQTCTDEQMRFVNKTKGSENFDLITWDMGNGEVMSSDLSINGAIQKTLGELGDFMYGYADSTLPGTPQSEGLDVSLFITDLGGCTDSNTVKVRPTKPVPYFEMKSVLTCSDHFIDLTIPSDTVPFLGFDPFVYNWLVTDESGDTVAQKEGVKFTFTRINLPLPTDTSKTKYRVLLRMEDFKRSTLGAACIDTVSLFYEFGQIFPIANFSIVPELNACPPRSVEFADSSIAAIHDGSVIPIVQWDWDFGDSSFSTVQNPAKIYTEPNLQGYDVSLTVTDASGCSNTLTLDNSVSINGVAGTLFGQKTTPDVDSVISEGVIMDFVEGDFSASPFNVRFTVGLADPADSSGVNRYILDFGDGQLGFGDTLDHTYILPGVYTPVLIIESTDSCRYTTDADFSIIANGCDLPELISSSDVVCDNESFLLSASPAPSAIEPITVSWTDLTSNLEIAQTDTVTVTLFDSRSFLYSIQDSVGCVSSLIHTVDVIQRPTLGVHGDTVLCLGDSIVVNSMVLDFDSVLGYQWTTSPDIGSSQDSLFQLPEVNESTLVRLTVTDTSASCETSSQFSVTVNQLPQVDAGLDETVCPGAEVQLQATYVSGGSGNPADFGYTWSGESFASNFVGNAAMVTATSTIIDVADTLTNVVEINDTLGCLGVDTMVVLINQGIEFNDFIDQQICFEAGVDLTGDVSGGVGDSTLFQFEWSPTLGLDDASAQNPNSTASASTTYVLTVTDEAGCEDTTSVDVVLQPFIFIDLRDSVAGCDGGSKTLTPAIIGGTGALSYLWSPSSLVNDSLALSPKVLQISDTLTYYVTAQDEVGCVRTDSVVVSPIYVYADANENQKICQGMQTQLQGLGSGQFGPLSYKWKMIGTTAQGTLLDADGLSNQDVQNDISDPLFLGNNRIGTYTYSLEVIDSLGCKSPVSSTMWVDVSKPQELDPLDSILHCFELEPELSLEGRSNFINYEWYENGDTTPVSNVSTPGDYVVGFEDSSQCFYLDTILVGSLCPPELYIPDAFSPNGDGLNDELDLYGKWVTEVHVILFNRWGEVIMELDAMSDSWDGSYRGKLVQLGSYPWQATYKGRYSEEVYTAKGHVTVVK